MVRMHSRQVSIFEGDAEITSVVHSGGFSLAGRLFVLCLFSLTEDAHGDWFHQAPWLLLPGVSSHSWSRLSVRLWLLGNCRT